MSVSGGTSLRTASTFCCGVAVADCQTLKSAALLPGILLPSCEPRCTSGEHPVVSAQAKAQRKASTQKRSEAAGSNLAVVITIAEYLGNDRLLRPLPE